MYPKGYKYRDWVVEGPQRRHALRPVRRRAGRRRPDRRARPRRSAGRARVLRPRPGLLRRGGLRRAGRPGRHPDPRLPRPDRRLRPLPRPQVRPDPDVRLLRPGRGLLQHRLQGIPRPPRPRWSRPTTRPRPRSRRRRPRSPPSSRPSRPAGPRRRAAVGVGPVHGRRLDPGQPPEGRARPADGRVRQGARGSRPSCLDRWVKYLDAEGRRQAAPPRPLAEAGRGQDPKVDLSGDDAAKAEVAKVAAAFQDYVRTTLALRDALEAQRVAARPTPPRVAAGRARLGGPEADVVRELASARRPVRACRRTRSRSTCPTTRKAALKAKRAELEKLKRRRPAEVPGGPRRWPRGRARPT